MRFAHQRIRLSVVFRIALILSFVAVLASIGVTVSARPRWNGPPPPSTYHYIDVANPYQTGHYSQTDLSVHCQVIRTMSTTPGTWYAAATTAGCYRLDIPYGPIYHLIWSLTGGNPNTDPNWYNTGVGRHNPPGDGSPTHPDVVPYLNWTFSDWISDVGVWSGGCHSYLIFQATQDTLYLTLPDWDCPDNDDGGWPEAYNEKYLDYGLYPVYFDTFPPETTHALSGTIGANGYYTSPVTVTLIAIDPESLPTQPAAGIGSTMLDGVAYGGPTLVSDQGTTTHSYYSVDLADNTEAAHSFDVTIDSVPPTSTITAPAHGSVVTGTITITGTASDATSGLDLVLVSTDGGTTWLTPAGTASWSLDWDTLGEADGPHTIMVSGTDLAGNLELPVSITVNVDNLPPTTVITTAPAGWVNGTITIAGTAFDTVSSVASVAYSSDGGMNWYAATGTDNWTFNWDTTTAPDGPVTMQVRSTDVMSHGEAPPVEAIIQVDNAPPTLAVTAAPSGWVTGVVTITGTLTDPHSGPAQVEYSLDDGTTWQTATGAAAWTFDVDTDPLPRGNTTILVRGLDALGNTSGPVFVTFNVGPPPSDEAQPGDTRLPHLEASWPAEWDITCGPASVDFNITASDDGSGIKGIAVIISGNGIADRVLKGPAQNWSGTLTWDGLDGAGNRVQPGVYRVWVGAWDHAGNYATREGSIRVTDCTIAAPMLAPTVIPPPPSTTTTTQTTGAPPVPAQGAPLPAATQPPGEVAELATGAVPQPAVIAPPPAASPRTIDGEASGAASTAAGVGVLALLSLAGAYMAARPATRPTTKQTQKPASSVASSVVTVIPPPPDDDDEDEDRSRWQQIGDFFSGIWNGITGLLGRPTQTPTPTPTPPPTSTPTLAPRPTPYVEELLSEEDSERFFYRVNLLLSVDSGQLIPGDPETHQINIVDPASIGLFPWSGRWMPGSPPGNYVCADIARDLYEEVGVDIDALLSDRGYGAPNLASRNAACYYMYMRDNHTLSSGSTFPYRNGELVILYDPGAADGRELGYHMGVVIQSGRNADEVLILQASYSSFQIEAITLREYAIERSAPWVLYNQYLRERGYDPDRDDIPEDLHHEVLAQALAEVQRMLENGQEDELLDMLVVHGYLLESDMAAYPYLHQPSRTDEKRVTDSGDKSSPSSGKPSPSGGKSSPSSGKPSPTGGKSSPSGGKPSPSSGKPSHSSGGSSSSSKGVSGSSSRSSTRRK